MFRKRVKPSKTVSRITLYGADGAVLASCPAAEFALPEETVLALSVEYFNDPEPCSIHRGAVHRRAMMELMEHCPAGQTVRLSELSERQRGYFAPNVAAVRIGEAME